MVSSGIGELEPRALDARAGILAGLAPARFVGLANPSNYCFLHAVLQV